MTELTPCDILVEKDCSFFLQTSIVTVYQTLPVNVNDYRPPNDNEAHMLWSALVAKNNFVACEQ